MVSSTVRLYISCWLHFMFSLILKRKPPEFSSHASIYLYVLQFRKGKSRKWTGWRIHWKSHFNSEMLPCTVLTVPKIHKDWSEAMQMLAVSEAKITLQRTHWSLLHWNPGVSLCVVLWLSSKYHIPLSAWYFKLDGLTPLPSILLHACTRRVTFLTADMLIPRKLFFTLKKHIYLTSTKGNPGRSELIHFISLCMLPQYLKKTHFQ